MTDKGVSLYKQTLWEEIKGKLKSLIIAEGFKIIYEIEEKVYIKLEDKINKFIQEMESEGLME